MKVTRTLHHSFNVEGQLAATVEFYRRLLGMSDDPRPEIPGVDGHWFGPGRPSSIWWTHRPEPGPSNRPVPMCASRSATWRGPSPNSSASGVPYVRGAQGTTVQIWFTDPAGNTVEIQQDTAWTEEPIGRVNPVLGRRPVEL